MVTRLKTFDPSDEQAFKKRKPKAVVAPKQKFDNLHLKQIKPLNEAQRQVFAGFLNGQHVVAAGSAGSGKTISATFLGLSKLFAQECQRVVFVRSAVQTREIGHLPGGIFEKTEVYTVPYKQLTNEICENGTAWDVLLKKGSVEFLTTSFIRGITLDNCVVIVDEFQNMNSGELYSVLTRCGQNCQFIICGDTRQQDLSPKKETSCYEWLMSTAAKMPKWFDVVHFFPNDIVRSGFVRDLVLATED